jgi:transcriptional regulator with XRE-family HTH domain
MTTALNTRKTMARRESTQSDQPNPIDVHVGGRVRVRRALLGMTQEKLGDAIGLAFQQVQKYERGTNRISASRLYDIATVLEVPVSFFFDELPDDAATAKASDAATGQAAANPFAGNPLARRETLELVRAYYRITESRVRKSLVELIRECAEATPEEVA